MKYDKIYFIVIYFNQMSDTLLWCYDDDIPQVERSVDELLEDWLMCPLGKFASASPA